MRTVTLKALIDMGYGDRLCPATTAYACTSTTRARTARSPTNTPSRSPTPTSSLYMHRHVIPDLKDMGVTDSAIDTLFVDNPQRFFAGT